MDFLFWNCFKIAQLLWIAKYKREIFLLNTQLFERIYYNWRWFLFFFRHVKFSASFCSCMQAKLMYVLILLAHNFCFCKRVISESRARNFVRLINIYLNSGGGWIKNYTRISTRLSAFNTWWKISFNAISKELKNAFEFEWLKNGTFHLFWYWAKCSVPLGSCSMIFCYFFKYLTNKPKINSDTS